MLLQVNFEGNPRVVCREVSPQDNVKVACGSVVSSPSSEVARAAPLAVPAGPLTAPTSNPKRGHIAAAIVSVLAAVGIAALALVLWRRQRWLRRQRGLRPYVDPAMLRGTFAEGSGSDVGSPARPAEEVRLAEM